MVASGNGPYWTTLRPFPSLSINIQISAATHFWYIIPQILHAINTLQKDLPQKGPSIAYMVIKVVRSQEGLIISILKSEYAGMKSCIMQSIFNGNIRGYR